MITDTRSASGGIRRRPPAYAKPELVATAPNQIWSWDITKLKGPIPCLYYSL